MVVYETKPGCSRLDPVLSWKPPRTKTEKTALSILFHCMTVLMRKTVFLISKLTLSCFHVCLLTLILPPLTTVMGLTLASWWPPGKYRGLLSSVPLFSKLNKPISLSFSQKVTAPTLNQLESSLLPSPRFISTFPLLGGSNWMQDSSCGLRTAGK